MTLTPQQINQMPQDEKDAALYDSASKGALDDVITLLNAGANPLTTHGHGDLTPLMIAALDDHLDVVNYLLKFESVVAQITANNNFALSGAATCGNLEMLNRLLEFDAVVGQLSIDASCALSRACAYGNLNVLNRLLEFDAVVAELPKDFLRIISVSIHGYIEIMERLLDFPEMKAQIADQNNRALKVAADLRQYRMATFLLEVEITTNEGVVTNPVRDALTPSHKKFLKDKGYFQALEECLKNLSIITKKLLEKGLPLDMIKIIAAKQFDILSDRQIENGANLASKAFLENQLLKADCPQAITTALKQQPEQSKKRKDEDSNHQMDLPSEKKLRRH